MGELLRTPGHRDWGRQPPSPILIFFQKNLRVLSSRVRSSDNSCFVGDTHGRAAPTFICNIEMEALLAGLHRSYFQLSGRVFSCRSVGLGARPCQAEKRGLAAAEAGNVSAESSGNHRGTAPGWAGRPGSSCTSTVAARVQPEGGKKKRKSCVTLNTVLSYAGCRNVTSPFQSFLCSF